MSYYQFNKKKVLQKAKKNCSKEKAAVYYLLNKEAIKKRYENMTDQEKQAKKQNQKIYYKKLKADKDKVLLEKGKRGKESG